MLPTLSGLNLTLLARSKTISGAMQSKIVAVLASQPIDPQRRVNAQDLPSCPPAVPTRSG
jgi:hypothetical protein